MHEPEITRLLPVCVQSTAGPMLPGLQLYLYIITGQSPPRKSPPPRKKPTLDSNLDNTFSFIGILTVAVRIIVYRVFFAIGLFVYRNFFIRFSIIGLISYSYRLLSVKQSRSMNLDTDHTTEN